MSNIDFSIQAFPANVINILFDSFSQFNSVHVFRRRIRTTDPNLTIGIYPGMWLPGGEGVRTPPVEIGNQGAITRNTFGSYEIFVQTLFYDADEERGFTNHATFVKHVRNRIEYDSNLNAALTGLASVTEGGREILSRVKITESRYFSDEINSRWINLGVIKLSILTEMRSA